MRPRLLLIPLFLSLACDAEDDAFRNATALEGDVTIHEDTTATNPDYIVWDIVGGNVHEGPAGSGPVGDVVLVVDGDTISTPDGVVQCTIDSSGWMPRLRLGENGVAVYTVFQKWILHGDFSVPPGNGGIAAVSDYTFLGDQVHEGIASGPVLVTASADLQFSSATRKLLIAALIDGTCGTSGL